MESGGINLQSVRHDEGKLITCLRKHTSAVSVLLLSYDERSVLSGSWDKTILDWDLNTGQPKRSFEGSGGQISAIEVRPQSYLPVPPESSDNVLSNGTLSSNNAMGPLDNGFLTRNDSTDMQQDVQPEAGDAGPTSPADSLFGGNDADSLFGDKDDSRQGALSGGDFGDEDDEFSRAIANGLQQQEADDIEREGNGENIGGPVQPLEPAVALEHSQGEKPDNAMDTNGVQPSATQPLANGLPHSEEIWNNSKTQGNSASSTGDPGAFSDTTFLAASMDGTLRVWDKRQQDPVARILPRNVPPWCMNACWSPDGNYIYAGRRNGTVEEFSLHKGLQNSERTFKFPQGSGPVSTVRAMPNGRHLIWYVSWDVASSPG